ncbi:FIGfam138462: Acyl-CoA synthetase, AMP-(fatty) acid ligase [uncultured Candidatus Thioglobus sp.]|nr:FIGfam138462: Acyl-CoA synthetase, AMP-(fatty) acid ligase [uncultured Candidatus Thioglobus sp.]
MNKMFKLLNHSNESVVAIYQGRPIFKAAFLLHIERSRKRLSSHKYAINLCDNRYHFLVTFAACVSLGKISLLPNSKAPNEIARLAKLYPDSQLIDDEEVADLYTDDGNENNISVKNFDIAAQQIVAILFTSGTTGKAKQNPKTWGQLNESSIRVRKRFWAEGLTSQCIIATTPPQHMFGFETSIIYPLTLGLTMHDSCPFYPLDIQQAALETPASKIIITTPLQLKTCVELTQGWDNIDSIICATSPLSTDIANNAEYVLGADVFEIYGCSESGAIATRRTSKNNQWKLLEDYRIKVSKNAVLLKAIGYDELIKISDQIKVIGTHFFYLLGRSEDLVKIGGKRESLSGLTCKLKKIDGIDDGVFFIPKKEANSRVRLAALVVSSVLNKGEIMQLLSQTVDAVFLPRPLKIVISLPYNKLGKLPLADLIKTINL